MRGDIRDEQRLPVAMDPAPPATSDACTIATFMIANPGTVFDHANQFKGNIT
jgi:hypothetical protein